MKDTLRRSVSFLDEVRAIPGGEWVNRCIQCGVCAGSCPNANKMDYTPRRIIAMVRAGLREEVLSSNSMWYCLSCYQCTVRCPREVKPTELMHALECLAIRHNLASRDSTTPIMYKTFTDSIKINGRVHEFGFMMRYYLKTNPFAALGMLPLGISLFFHGRLPLRAKRIKGKKELRAILEKAKSLGGT